MSLGQVIYINVDKIHANRYNPNVMTPERYEALVDFCQTHGAEQLDPIWVRHDGVDTFEVIDGEHRWKAAKEVGWKRVRAFIIEIEEDDAKAFNVRKNRERGEIDAFKLGRIFKSLKEQGRMEIEIAKKFGYSVSSKQACSTVSELIDVAEREEEIRQRLGIFDASKRVSIYRAIKVLRELKREERGETFEDQDEITEEKLFGTKQLENFLHRYAKALKKNPLPNVQKDEVETALDFFKRLLENKQIHCPICGEKHLQWKCGHEF